MAAETEKDIFEQQIEYLHTKYDARVYDIDMPPMDISSSEIVRRI